MYEASSAFAIFITHLSQVSLTSHDRSTILPKRTDNGLGQKQNNRPLMCSKLLVPHILFYEPPIGPNNLYLKLMLLVMHSVLSLCKSSMMAFTQLHSTLVVSSLLNATMMLMIKNLLALYLASNVAIPF